MRRRAVAAWTVPIILGTAVLAPLTGGSAMGFAQGKPAQPPEIPPPATTLPNASALLNDVRARMLNRPSFTVRMSRRARADADQAWRPQAEVVFSVHRQRGVTARLVDTEGRVLAEAPQNHTLVPVPNPSRNGAEALPDGETVALWHELLAHLFAGTALGRLPGWGVDVDRVSLTLAAGAPAYALGLPPSATTPSSTVSGEGGRPPAGASAEDGADFGIPRVVFDQDRLRPMEITRRRAGGGMERIVATRPDDPRSEGLWPGRITVWRDGVMVEDWRLVSAEVE